MSSDQNDPPPPSPSPRASRLTPLTVTDLTSPDSGESPPASPRRASTSLQAAATLNAGLHSEISRRSPTSGRRRSVVAMNLQINDPFTPAPGEMVLDNQSPANGNGFRPGSPRRISGSPILLPRSPHHHRTPSFGEPHHHRTPSLGELHQELEAEQEAQVNRLLGMIRQQQLQLQQLQASQGQPSAEDTSAVSDRSAALPISQPGSVPHSAVPGQSSGSFSQSPRHPHPRSSFDMARADLHRRSRTPSRAASRGASPRLRATSMSNDINDGTMLSGRDESAFYQAETQMLVRENQMLKHRIRELEKQLADAHITTLAPHEPGAPSHLIQATSAAEMDKSDAPAVAGPSTAMATSGTS